jgi:hypothetical protein
MPPSAREAHLAKGNQRMQYSEVEPRAREGVSHRRHHSLCGWRRQQSSRSNPFFDSPRRTQHSHGPSACSRWTSSGAPCSPRGFLVRFSPGDLDRESDSSNEAKEWLQLPALPPLISMICGRGYTIGPLTKPHTRTQIQTPTRNSRIAENEVTMGMHFEDLSKLNSTCSQSRVNQ